MTLRYFYSLLWSPRYSSTKFSPIQNEILYVLRRTKGLSKARQSTVLRREVRDLATLYWATRESDIASMVFLSGFLTFFASVVFTVARIFRLERLNDFAYVAFATSSLGAILAAFHFVRKLALLTRLWFELSSKAKQVTVNQKRGIRMIRAVTGTQILLTIARLLAAGAAAVALPWAVAENGFSDSIRTPPTIPFWIALGAVSTAIAATVFFFLVEYVIRYNLPTDLGPFVCGLFRGEIESIYDAVTILSNDIETKEVQDRVNWEYTARDFLHKYRFDTVFAADRFGQILQYIQSGMDTRHDKSIEDLEVYSGWYGRIEV